MNIPTTVTHKNNLTLTIHLLHNILIINEANRILGHVSNVLWMYYFTAQPYMHAFYSPKPFLTWQSRLKSLSSLEMVLSLPSRTKLMSPQFPVDTIFK